MTEYFREWVDNFLAYGDLPDMTAREVAAHAYRAGWNGAYAEAGSFATQEMYAQRARLLEDEVIKLRGKIAELTGVVTIPASEATPVMPTIRKMLIRDKDF